MGCTGCAFTTVNLNSLNSLESESGCLAAIAGASTQISGYPCVTMQMSGNKVTSCAIHKSCGVRNTTDSNKKSCLYTLGGFSGVASATACPADRCAVVVTIFCPVLLIRQPLHLWLLLA